MMNITVGDGQVTYQNGALALKYVSVSFTSGQFPDSLSGSVQVTPDDGITLSSSTKDIEAAAKTKIQAMVVDEAPAS